MRSLASRRGTAIVAVVIVCTLAIVAIVLHLTGQPVWCTCGFKILTLDAWGSESSQNFIDPYTTSHVLHGILFFALLGVITRSLSMQARLLIAFLIEVGWELLENSPLIINRYRDATASLGYTGDTIINSISDILFMLVGFWLAARLPWKTTLALLVLTELLMLLLYRDNLTLNVLMLTFPIDAIRDWQMAH